MLNIIVLPSFAVIEEPDHCELFVFHEAPCVNTFMLTVPPLIVWVVPRVINAVNLELVSLVIV